MEQTVAPAVPTSSVIRQDDVRWIELDPSEPGSEIRVGHYLDETSESVHLTVAVCELAPGGHVVGHLHPFEESFYVLEGGGLVSIDGASYDVVPDDFGLVPIAAGHAWSNPYAEPLRWLRVHAPKPRPLGSGRGVYAADAVEPPTQGRRVDELDPTVRHLGHFDERDLTAPGMISMPGYHGANIKKVSIRMMVDDLLGARQHTLFVVQFDPATEPGLSAQEHFHAFEEMYFFVQGQATGSFDGHREEGISAGDMVFAPVRGAHGFVNTGDVPVRWIEAQAPMPPASHGFFFHADWDKLEPIG